MKLSACIEALFVNECAVFEDRITAAGAAGVDTVEFWLWRDKNLDGIERALKDSGVGLTLFSVEPRLPIVERATHRDFIAGLRESVALATRLKARGLCVLADDRGLGGSTTPRDNPTRDEQHKAIVAALTLAAPIAADAGVTLLLEPLNTKLDHIGYFLDRTSEGLDIIEAVGQPSVRLLYDAYHSTMMGETPETALGDRGSLVGHVHVADVPGRHEPGSGTIDWRSYMTTFKAKGCGDVIGLEFWPTGATSDALALTRDKLGAG